MAQTFNNTIENTLEEKGYVDYVWLMEMRLQRVNSQ